jgi:hypothetical protein
MASPFWVTIILMGIFGTLYNLMPFKGRRPSVDELDSEQKELLDMIAELNRKCDVLAIEMEIQKASNKLTS